MSSLPSGPARAALFGLQRTALLTFMAWLISGCGERWGDAAVRAETNGDSSVPVPLVLGPVTGGIRTGQPFGTSMVALLPHYVEEEFIIQGTAQGHGGAAGTTAPYATRVLVRRPRDSADFNGTVVVDWNNVTLQFDFDTGWFAMADILMSRGYAYVGVSAQNQGVDGSPLGLFFWDPARYGLLTHPGDDYSYDIFSQAGQALLDPKVLGPALLAKMEYRIASGASQSAGRLSTYINDVHEQARVFDAFFPQISGASDVRKDIGPQLWWLSQDEAALVAEPPEDTEHFRYWETAGSPHTVYASNAYIRAIEVYNFGSAATLGRINTYNPFVDRQYGEQDLRGNCTINRYPGGLSWSAAFVALDRWLRTGKAPSSAPRMARDEAGELTFDEHGNALGGVRSPVLDVPIASYYAGALPPTATLTPCSPGGPVPLLGTSQTFPASKLAALYPTHEDYVQKFEASADAIVANGWLLTEHHAELMSYARAADVTDPVGRQIPTAPGVPPIPIPRLPVSPAP
jgi:hypothetical protein